MSPDFSVLIEIGLRPKSLIDFCNSLRRTNIRFVRLLCKEKPMKIVLLDAGTLGRDIDISCFAKLGEFTAYPATAPEAAPERIKNADIVITNKVKLTEPVLSQAKNVKLVCITATGFDNVDMNYARAHGIGVCNVRDYSTDSVVQVTVSLVLALACHLPFYDRYCKSGAYTASGVHNLLEPVFYELAGKTWGLYGYGSIGKRVADVARAFGCNILVCRRHAPDGEKIVTLPELFEKSDIISLHTPLNDATRRSVSAQVLAGAAKKPILVNAARGAVVDEEAVTKAVESGLLSGFATDVYAEEPMRADSPFHRLAGKDNVIFTPHMAWGAYEARMRLVEEVYKNIEVFLAGGTRSRVDLV